MWINEKMAILGREKHRSEHGLVTIGGSKAAVLMSGEARGLEAIMPRGLAWKPDRNQLVAVLHSDLGDRFLLGAVSEGHEDIDCREIKLFSDEASIILKNNGEIHLSGRLFLNGTEIKAGE